MATRTALRSGEHPSKTAPLSARTLLAMNPGQWLADPAPKGYGRLLARKLSAGHVMFYFRYSREDGTRDTLKIGLHSETGRNGLTLPAARDKVAKLRAEYVSGTRDLRAAAACQADPIHQTSLSAVVHAGPCNDDAKGTLGNLLDGYANQLERDGRIRFAEVRRDLHRYVRDSWPEKWAMPISQVSTDDLLAIIAKVVDTGKLRTAEKLRAYLRAAYAMAMSARRDAHALSELRDLHVTMNVARDLIPVKGANKARNRWLSTTELRHYWTYVSQLPCPAGPTLRFHLLTGCQRLDQLARLQTADVDPDGRYVSMLDPKGRRSEPRIHLVPLLPDAQKALSEMHGGTLGPYVFTVTAGEFGTSYKTAELYLRDVASKLLEQEKARTKFTLGDLRRTVETLLAEVGVPKEVRAHLQSHGLGGVQDRHYNRYEYFREKQAALELLFKLLAAPRQEVAALRWENASHPPNISIT